jgi:hypothetical protein
VLFRSREDPSRDGRWGVFDAFVDPRSGITFRPTAYSPTVHFLPTVIPSLNLTLEVV